jgi:hypothetical protein
MSHGFDELWHLADDWDVLTSDGVPEPPTRHRGPQHPTSVFVTVATQHLAKLVGAQRRALLAELRSTRD